LLLLKEFETEKLRFDQSIKDIKEKATDLEQKIEKITEYTNF